MSITFQQRTPGPAPALIAAPRQQARPLSLALLDTWAAEALEAHQQGRTESMECDSP